MNVKFHNIGLCLIRDSWLHWTYDAKKVICGISHFSVSFQNFECFRFNSWKTEKQLMLKITKWLHSSFPTLNLELVQMNHHWGFLLTYVLRDLTACKHTEWDEQTHHVWRKYQNPLVSPTGPLRVTEQIRIVLCHFLHTWRTQNTERVIQPEVSETVEEEQVCVCCVCSSKQDSYMVQVLHCCSDEPEWSSSARCHGNATEGSELWGSPERCRSSASPRRWLGKATERMTPSEEEKLDKSD